MKKLLLALVLLCAPTGAWAQCNGTFANNTVCGNATGGPNLPRPVPFSSVGAGPGGSVGQTQYNLNGAAFGGYTPSGDVTVNPATGVETIQPSAVTTGKIADANVTTVKILDANVTNPKLVAGAANTYKGSTNGTTITDIAITGLLNTICSLLPSTCSTVLGYTSIQWYGAKCDGIFQSNQNFDQPATNISITSGTPNLLSSGSTFTSADVGKRIWVPGAGAAGVGLSTTISAFVDATHVTLAVNASTTVTAVAATNTAPFVYGTDDTTTIQAAMTANPIGVKLYIPGSRTGCVIRQQGANTYALIQNKPYSIVGDGHFSNLMTFPDTPSTVDNLLVDPSSGWDWTGISWSGFSIGMSPSFIPPTFIMYKRYGKRGLAIVDTPAANLVDFNITSVMIGESGNDYSLHIGNATSSASQGGNIEKNKIFGGMHLQLVSDSFKVKDNWLYGASTFGGLYEFGAGAAGFVFSENNTTWAGCTIFESGTKLIVTYNYFEEVATASSCARNAMVDFNGGTGTINGHTFIGNVVGSLVSNTATPVRYNNVSAGIFGDNTITTTTARTGVTSVTTLSCSALNLWNTASPHFSTAIATPNPFTC